MSLSKLPGQDPDVEIIQQVLHGNQAAYNLLVAKYQRKIQRLLMRYVRNTHDCEDLAQEVFLNAYLALPNFRFESRFSSWLHSIAANRALKFLKSRNNTLSLHGNVQESGEVDETFSADSHLTESDTPDALLESKQIGNEINAAIEDLPPEYRESLLLREMDGMSYDDIGKALDIPPGTVRSRIFRAREAVAKRLRPLLGRQAGGKRW